jgi:hypothetical protein
MRAFKAAPVESSSFFMQTSFRPTTASSSDSKDIVHPDHAVLLAPYKISISRNSVMAVDLCHETLPVRAWWSPDLSKACEAEKKREDRLPDTALTATVTTK